MWMPSRLLLCLHLVVLHTQTHAAPVASTTSPASPPPSADTRLMFEVAMLSNAATLTRGSEEALTDLAYGKITRGIPKVNEQYGTNMELVWGPAFIMNYQAAEMGAPMTNNLMLNAALLASEARSAVEDARGKLDKSKTTTARNTTGSNLPTFINAIFAARDAATNTYYVGIAGTNGVSAENWIAEDFAVSKMVPWKYGAAGTTASVDSSAGPAVFAGLNFGLTALQSATPINNASIPGAGETFGTFLNKELASIKTLGAMSRSSPASITVRVAGHSLGGGLTPLFALWLQDTLLNTPSAAVTANIFAGVTPGNAAFAQYYNARPLAARTVTTNNANDVVPHAWSRDTILQLPSLYADVIPGVAPCMIPVADFLLSLAGDNADNATRVNPRNNPTFSVGFAPGVGTEPAVATPAQRRTGSSAQTGGDDASFDLFGKMVWGQSWGACKPVVDIVLRETMWQHVDAYFEYLFPVAH